MPKEKEIKRENSAKWQCKIANSLGDGFAGTPNEVWGTTDYKSDKKPTVFFGCYGLPDFYTVWRHKGKKAILWAGSDIRHFSNHYWLDNKGNYRVDNKGMAEWINDHCENYVENLVEYSALKKLGITSKIVPSFLGNVNDYKVEFKFNDRPKLYTSVSGNDFKVYGWHKVEKLASEHPEIDFYLYGNTKEWKTINENVIIRGRVTQEQMNKEIKGMTGALRMTEFDGFSEIICKSILWGQYPVSLIEYPFMLSVDEISKLYFINEPNIKGREYYLKNLNKYIWNANTHI